MSILRLKEILKEKSITGKDLAQKVGVTQATISNINNGVHFPTADLLLKIAQTLNVDVRDLFYSSKEELPIHLIMNSKLHIFNDISELKKFVNQLKTH